MKVAILGGGFGLYGYLPALLLNGQQVVLPERYRVRLSERQDVGRFVSHVEWSADERAALEAATAVVVCRRPADQVELIPTLSGTAIRRILLEKPLAPDPAAARGLMEAVRQNGLLLRVGYIFRHVPWAERLQREMAAGRTGVKITLRWRFRAHHYVHDHPTWKRSVQAGGGALRFYGIHLIALLAELGYDRVAFSVCTAHQADDAKAWRAQFDGDNLPEMHVEIDSDCAETSFSISASDRVDAILAQDHPFLGIGQQADLDGRVGALAPLCRDFTGSEELVPSRYDDALNLWATVEQVNAFHQSHHRQATPL